MTLADKITSSRLVLAPMFFVVYFFPRLCPSVLEAPKWTVPFLWILFLLCEITDMLDGFLARKRGEVSDFGKLYDPFADTLTQVTFFFCFVLDGILPPILFLVVLYREFSILFIRNLMLKKGIAMGARKGGKVKTVAYILAAGLALLASSVLRFSSGGELYRWLVVASTGVFIVSVVFAVVSFIDYFIIYRKLETGSGTKK